MDRHRTPMAWQHRDMNMSSARDESDGSGMMPNSHKGGYGYPPNTPRSAHSQRYGGPPTPSSAHSRATRTSAGRRETRGSSSERYSHHSGRKMSSSRDSGVSQHMSNGGGSRKAMSMGAGRRHHPASPSSTEETTNGEEETTETDSQAPQDHIEYPVNFYPGYPMPVAYPLSPAGLTMAHPQLMSGPIAPPQLYLAPGGSVRSVHSVPVLATWDGEPCPVHHHHAHHHPQQHMPLAALYGMAPSHTPAPAASVISAATTVRRARSVAELSQMGGVPMMAYSTPNTPHMHPRQQHAHHGLSLPRSVAPPGSVSGRMLVLGENGAPSALPLRDGHMNGKDRSPIPPKDDKAANDLDCCSGHFVIVWIILGIVTFGVLLGIILKFTIA